MSHAIIRRMVCSTSDAPRSLLSAKERACPHCLAANARTQPHPGSILPAAPRPGSRIHADLTGILLRSVMGFHYFAVFVNEFSRFVFGYLLRTRDEVNAVVKRFLADFRAVARTIDRVSGMPSAIRANIDIEQLRTDCAGEFTTSHAYTELLHDNGTRPEYSPAYAKDPNGGALRRPGV